MLQGSATIENSLKKPTVILFDWDCTLVDSKQLLCSAINETLKSLDMPVLSLEAAYESTSMTPDQTFRYLFGDHAVEAKKIFYDILKDYPMDELVILDGVEGFLDYCLESGYAMALVSNKNGPMLRREVKHLGLESYFKAIVGSGDASEGKPSSAPALKALGQMNRLAGKDVWLIGDNIVDWQCANAAGCQPVRIWPNNKDFGDLPNGTVSVENFLNLRDIIENL